MIIKCCQNFVCALIVRTNQERINFPFLSFLPLFLTLDLFLDFNFAFVNQMLLLIMSMKENDGVCCNELSGDNNMRSEANIGRIFITMVVFIIRGRRTLRYIGCNDAIVLTLL